jgi:hypothetical protein
METRKLLIGGDELVETVRCYSNLYDPVDKYYHDVLRKDNTLEEISEIIKCPGKDEIIISINNELTVTTAWHVLGLRIEEKASRYGG